MTELEKYKAAVREIVENMREQMTHQNNCLDEYKRFEEFGKCIWFKGSAMGITIVLNKTSDILKKHGLTLEE